VDLGDAQATQAARRMRTAKLLPQAVFDDMEGVLTVLSPTTNADDVKRIVADLARGAAGTEWRGVQSRPVREASAAPGVFLALRRAMPVLRRLGVRGYVVNQNEIALYSTLFETHDQESLAAFLQSAIGALTGYDEKRGTELASTLLGYFDSNQNAKLAAQRLGIHVNTVRQRLATIEDLIGHLGNPTRALEVHVALRLWHLTRGAEHG
jgi:DNA-binding PucR family transcriptional regulator